MRRLGAVPNLSAFLGGLREGQYQRLVLGLNLCQPEEQPALLVQGRSRDESGALVAQACQAGMPCMDARDAAAIMKSNLPHRSVASELTQFPAHALTDGSGLQDRFRTGFKVGRRYSPTRDEATGTTDLLAATVASKLTAEHQPKLFES